MRSTVSAFALVLLAPLAASAQTPPPPPPVPTTPEVAPAPPPVPPPAAVAAPAPEPAPMPPMPAAPAPAAAPAAAPAVAAPVGPVNWEFLTDAYYMYNFTGDPSTQAPVGRSYDTAANSFTLNYTEISAQLAPTAASPVGFRIDLGYGHTGAITNSSLASASGTASLSTATSGSPASTLYTGGGFILQQAYGTAKLFDMLTLDAGRFVTSASSEVMETRNNWNYSRSFLFGGVPYIHTGVRLNLKVNDMIGIEGSVVNGINNDPDNNADKTFELALKLTPDAATSISALTYIGKETSGPGAETSILVDVVAARTITETVAVNLNVDYNKTGSTNWWGVSGMGRVVVNPCLNIALRGEYLKSKSLYGGMMGDIALYEGTLTAGIPVAKNFEFRAEVRGDFSDKEAFSKGKTPKKNQFTGLIGFLAWL